MPRGTKPPGRPRRAGSRRVIPVLLFLGPAALLLGVVVGYPAVATVVRSLYDTSGGRFVGLDNYRTLFTTTTTLIAIRNNAIWVIVFPSLVTFLGLVFAVLTERIRWATAFKTIVFAPMAVSLFASGVIWRIVYETDPGRGLLNSVIGTVADAVHAPGLYAGPTVQATSGLRSRAGGAFVSTASVSPGGTVQLGLTGIPPSSIPAGAAPASTPRSAPGAVQGVVWRDFSPGGRLGVIDRGELGLPGIRLTLRRADGGAAGSTTSADDGSFHFDRVATGSYHVVVDSGNFQPGFRGVDWLGTRSLTPTSGLGETGRALLTLPLAVIAEIIAMLWIWSGFSMVVIGAGLAALDREVLEAARMDGAGEWQTFRRVTLPLLAPVLVVVLVTMIINVLKIFDVIVSITPDSSQQQSTVLALEMWRIGFTGVGDKGVGSAVAVFLFVLVVPVMLLNVRRIRG
jgi:alpha-glucoside transport system permease protein